MVPVYVHDDGCCLNGVLDTLGPLGPTVTMVPSAVKVTGVRVKVTAVLVSVCLCEGL